LHRESFNQDGGSKWASYNDGPVRESDRGKPKTFLAWVITSDLRTSMLVASIARSNPLNATLKLAFHAIDFALVWNPSYAPARKTERFKTLVRNAGLVEYWRAKGWPAQCHPTTSDDFECN